MSIPSSRTSKYTPTIIILSLSLSLLILPFSKSNDLIQIQSSCSENKLTPNTDYQTNLNTLITTLNSTTATSNPTGFFSTTVGTTTTNSTAYGLLLCYGDQNPTTCHDCATAATETAASDCSDSKGAIIWYDACMLRYSNKPLLGKMELSPWGMIMDVLNVDGNRTRFTELVRSTVGQLAVKAGSSEDRLKRKLARKVVKFTSEIEVHVLAQCTPDIDGDACTQCLTTAGSDLMLTKLSSQSSLPSCTVKFFTQTIADVDDPHSTVSTGKNKVSAKVITSIVVPVGVISIMAVIVIYLFRIKRAKYNTSSFSTGGDLTTVEGLQFPLNVLQYATDNFSEENKLGTGGFGAVYKGTLKNGQEIAVKRLFITSGQGIQDFKNEIFLVAKLQHRNLVPLYGFCFEQNEKLLVYEYLANKSLDRFIFDPKKQGEIDWRMRYQIIIGIARGMLYLHEDSRHRVIHRDLKASNVLLDFEMNPKIADFGMARIFGMDQTHGSTNRVVGTYGYMPPEYAMHGLFSIKSDVYSFGVLTLEIISGKMISDFTHPEHIGDLLSYAFQKWREEKPLEFVDQTIIRSESCVENEVMRCLHIGLLCVQHSRDERPTMAEIVQMLDNYSTPLSMPPDQQPAFFVQTRIESGSDQDQSSTQNLISWTTNDASISNIEPR